MRPFILLAFAACSSPSSLLKLVPLEPGDDCAEGGQLVQTGLDDNGDGVLSPAEVDDEQPICDGADGDDGSNGADGSPGADGEDAPVSAATSTPSVIYGNVLAENHLDLQVLAGVQEVTGNLTISCNHDFPSLFPLDSIRRVGGNLIATNCSQVPDLRAFANLEEVGRELKINDFALAEDLGPLGNLRTVGEELRISRMPLVTSLAPLAALESAGPIYIDFMSGLCSSEIEAFAENFQDGCSCSYNGDC